MLTRTPLSTWFAAVWFITSQKNGVSALGLQRVLGFGSYETAWAWMHKLRRAMVRPDRDLLSGVVELDEVFIGNETRGKAGGLKDNTAAMVAVESMPGRNLGRVRMEVSPLAGSAALVEFAQRTIAPGSTIRRKSSASSQTWRRSAVRRAEVRAGAGPVVDRQVTVQDATGRGVDLLVSVLPQPGSGGLIGVGARRSLATGIADKADLALAG